MTIGKRPKHTENAGKKKPHRCHGRKKKQIRSRRQDNKNNRKILNRRTIKDRHKV